METTNKTIFERIADVWHTIYIPCHFIPLITSIGWIIHYTLEPSNFIVNYILFPLMVIGWGAALIARLLDFVSLGLERDCVSAFLSSSSPSASCSL